MSNRFIFIQTSDTVGGSQICTGKTISYDSTLKRCIDVNVVDQLTHGELLSHQGLVWNFSVFTTAVAANGNIDILFDATTPHAHFLFACATEGTAKVELFEDASVSASTTLLTFQNRKRYTTNTYVQKAYLGLTLNTTGSLISTELVPGGAKNFGSGGESALSPRVGAEWLLAPTKKYLIRYTNLSASTVGASLVISFYEQTVT